MSSKKIREILTPNIIDISENASIDEAVNAMKENDISCVLIMEGRKAKGIITERGLVQFIANKGINLQDKKVGDIMRSPVMTANQDIDIYSAYNISHAAQVRHLVVVDAHGEVVGIITQTDIIEYLSYGYFLELKTVSQIMTKRLIVVSEDSTVLEAFGEMDRMSVSCLVVGNENRACGILTERDIVRLLNGSEPIDKIKIKHVMSTPVESISENIPILEVAGIMKRKGIRRMVVSGDDDTIIGLTTQTDIVKELEGRYIANLEQTVKDKQAKIENTSRMLAEKTVYLDNILQSSIEMGIIAVGLNFQIVYFNPAAEEILEMKAADVIGRSVQEIHDLSGVDSDRFKKLTNKTRQGTNHSFTFSKQTSNGIRHIHGRMTGIVDAQKTELGFVLMVRDITDQKIAEEKILRQKENLELMNADLAALYEVSTKISRTIQMSELMAEILRVVTGLKILNVQKKGGIFVLEGEKMKLVAHLGHTEEFVHLHRNMKVGDCLCGLAAKTGEVIISGDCMYDDRHTIREANMTPHGHIVLPLKSQNRVVGVLYLYTPVNDGTLGNEVLKLLTSIGNQIGIAIENAKLYEETKFLSYYDPLTKVANRRLMNTNIEKFFAAAKRYGKHLSVLMMDIDHFKRYNDEKGHHEGDVMLSEVARLVVEVVRNSDLVARYGGEEFLVMLPETHPEGAMKTAERIRKIIEQNSACTISIGVSQYSEDMKNYENLIAQADENLYKAKREGRNRVEG